MWTRKHVQFVKVESQRKVVKDVGGKGCTEEDFALVDVAKELERIRVRCVLPQDGPRLQDELVGAEIIAFEKSELIFVGEVQRPCAVLEDAEVEGFNPLG